MTTQALTLAVVAGLLIAFIVRTWRNRHEQDHPQPEDAERGQEAKPAAFGGE